MSRKPLRFAVTEGGAIIVDRPDSWEGVTLSAEDYAALAAFVVACAERLSVLDAAWTKVEKR